MQVTAIGREDLRLTPRLFLFVLLAWVLGCTGVGVTVAAIIGEHGSIVFAMAGVILGVCGGCSNALLLLVPTFRKASSLARLLTLWLLIMASISAAGAWPHLMATEPAPELRWEGLFVSLLWAAIPVLIVAAGLSWATERVNASAEA